MKTGRKTLKHSKTSYPAGKVTWMLMDNTCWSGINGATLSSLVAFRCLGKSTFFWESVSFHCNMLSLTSVGLNIRIPIVNVMIFIYQYFVNLFEIRCNELVKDNAFYH